MTDKERILAEIERLINDLGEQRDINLEDLRDFINSLPEEPVSKDYRERYKRIAQSEEFKKTHEGMSIGEIIHVEGLEPVSEEIEVSYDAKINEAHRLGREEGMFLAKTMLKEPVSEDLEDAAETYTNRRENEKFEVGEGYGMDDVENAFKAGAQWQNQKTITKISQWLQSHSYDYIEFGQAGFGASFDYPKMIEDLRKAMSES